MILEIKTVPEVKNPFFLRKKYVDEGWSARQIALEVGSSHSTVIFDLKKSGIPRRKEDIPPRDGRTFGKRVVKRREIPNKRELETIKKMKELRLAGYSYHKIADILNTLGFNTKPYKAKWHATTVMKVLKRASQNEDLTSS